MGCLYCSTAESTLYHGVCASTRILAHWQPGDIAKIQFNVVQANATSQYQYPDLKITSSTPSIGTMEITMVLTALVAKLQIRGAKPPQTVTVVAAFYNCYRFSSWSRIYNLLNPVLTLAPSENHIFPNLCIGSKPVRGTCIPENHKLFTSCSNTTANS